jgi:hypothetical protein
VVGECTGKTKLKYLKGTLPNRVSTKMNVTQNISWTAVHAKLSELYSYLIH